MKHRFVSRVVAAVVIAVVAAGCAPSSNSGPNTSGINDFGCRPGPGKAPVVMLHGLGANGGLNWFTKAALVSGAGYCVFTPTYGKGFLGLGGLQSMRNSAAEISDYIDGILDVTGAPKVDIVGHSQGTTVGAYYIKFLGGDTKVRNFVGFGSNYRGTTLHGLSSLAQAVAPLLFPVLDEVCESCREYLPPSDFLDDLNEGGVTKPGPKYTNIVSRLDAIVVPYHSGILVEPGVTNITLQDHCPLDLTGHLAMAIDPNVTALILWALNGGWQSKPICLPFVAPI